MVQMVLLEDLHIICNECKKEHRIDKDCLEYDVEFLEERGMGAEFEHDFRGEERCSKCGNWMSFTVMGYEYPEGAYNSQDKESFGCTFIREPVVGIVWEYEFDYPPYMEGELFSLVNKVERNIYVISDDPDRVYDLTPAEFEELVAEVFRRNGFEVMVTPKTRDGGKDIIASYNMNGIPCMLIIECKRYAPKKKVGVGVVRALHGTQQAEHYGKAVVVTSSSFSRDAQQFASGLRDMIVLVDRNQLMAMLNRTMNR